jgi:hypothetical protein
LIAWPALLSYAGQAELDYIADEHQWRQLGDSHHLHPHRDDRLIDCEGQLFRPVRHEDHIELQSLGSRLSVEEAILLVQRHEAAVGRCCVAKFAASSIRQCIEALKDSD